MNKAKNNVQLPLIVDLLQERDVRTLFDRESVFISKGNAVASKRARELLGNNAVDRVCENISLGGKEFNVYHIDDKAFITYLYYEGFMRAATYHNLEMLDECGYSEH